MDRSENMRAIRGKNSAPEIAVRKLVHRLGYRFRLHASDLPGSPDLVFRARRKVIFVHGCFWHSHACKTGLIPNSNREFWSQKLQGNKDRDRRNIRDLKKLGWDVLVLWQCELKQIDELNERISQFLGGQKSA